MFLCMEKVCYDDRNKQRGADTYMDIAALSVVMSQQQVKTDAGIAIMKQAKDVMQNEGEQLIEMIEESAVPHPNLGHQVDEIGRASCRERRQTSWDDIQR